MKLTHLSNQELHQQTLTAAQTEKNATLELLKYLREVEMRRLFAERGYSSLFEYIVKALHYSEAAASERVAAMRLVKDGEKIKRAIEDIKAFGLGLGLKPVNECEAPREKERKVTGIMKPVA